MESADGSWFSNELEPFYKQDQAHSNSIETCSFNPQEANQLVTGSHDHLIKVWDLNKFKNTSVLAGHSAGVWATQFSQDGKILMSASPDKTVLLWDLGKKKPIQSLKEHKNKVYFASFNENSKLIASGGEDQRLIIWDLRKGTYQKIIQSQNKIIYNVRWSKDGKFLFTSEYGGIVKAYDTQKFDLLDQFGTYRETDRAWTLDMDFRENSKSDNNIFVGDERKVCEVLGFDKKNGKFVPQYEFYAHMAPIRSINVDGPNGLFATGCRDGSSRVWEVTKSVDEMGRIKHRTVANLVGHNDNVTCAQFAPNNKKGQTVLATVSWDQSMHIYKL